MRIQLSLSAILLASVAAPLHAAEAQPEAGSALHGSVSPEIIVTAPYARDRHQPVAAVTVLQGERLMREMRSTIGETLARQPGVSSTFFGPNASRPILRGLDGERVRVLTDGIGSFDVSNTSVDHAVVINPLLAERIEVLRGPASLLYGSSAIGGVVNVIDKRIPREVPDRAGASRCLGNFGSAGDRAQRCSGVVEVPVADRIVLHADGSFAESDDLRIGGFVLSRPARAAALASADPAVRDLAAIEGRLPNSAARTWTAAGRGRLHRCRWRSRRCLSHYDSLYGVPPRFDLTTGDGEAMRLEVKQDRIDMRGQINAGGSFFDTINFRFGCADYRHYELDDTGAIGTTFLNQGLEGRIEAPDQARHGRRQGAAPPGYSFSPARFRRSAMKPSSRATTPIRPACSPCRSSISAPLSIEAAGRYEHADVKASAAISAAPRCSTDRNFDLFSGSLGASLRLLPKAGARGEPVTHRTRARRRGTVCQWRPCRHAGVRDRQPRFRQGSARWGRKRCCAAAAMATASNASAFTTASTNFIFSSPTGDGSRMNCRSSSMQHDAPSGALKSRAR